MPTITETHPLSITIIQHGFAHLVDGSLVFPSEVEANTPFDISYSVENTGPIDDELMGRLLDSPEGTVIPGSNWSETVASGATVDKTFTHPGLSAPATLVLEIGHE